MRAFGLGLMTVVVLGTLLLIGARLVALGWGTDPVLFIEGMTAIAVAFACCYLLGEQLLS